MPRMDCTKQTQTKMSKKKPIVVTIKKSKSRKRPYVATFDGVELEPVGGCRPWVAMRAGLRKLGAASWFTGQSVNRIGTTHAAGTYVSRKFNNREIKINYAHK